MYVACFPCGYGSRLSVSLLRPWGRWQMPMDGHNSCAGAMERLGNGSRGFLCLGARKGQHSASGAASCGCWPATVYVGRSN